MDPRLHLRPLTFDLQTRDLRSPTSVFSPATTTHVPSHFSFLTQPLHLVLKLNTENLKLLPTVVLGEVLGNWEAEKPSMGAF
jgi:hypothetical protein